MSSIAITHLTPIIIHLTADQYHKNGGYFAGIICIQITNHYNHSRDIKGWNIRYVTCTVSLYIYHHIPRGKTRWLVPLAPWTWWSCIAKSPYLAPSIVIWTRCGTWSAVFTQPPGWKPTKKTDELKLETKQNVVFFFFAGFFERCLRVETGNHSIKQDILTEESRFQCVLSRCSKLWLQFFVLFSSWKVKVIDPQVKVECNEFCFPKKKCRFVFAHKMNIFF